MSKIVLPWRHIQTTQFCTCIAFDTFPFIPALDHLWNITNGLLNRSDITQICWTLWSKTSLRHLQIPQGPSKAAAPISETTGLVDWLMPSVLSELSFFFCCYVKSIEICCQIGCISFLYCSLFLSGSENESTSFSVFDFTGNCSLHRVLFHLHIPHYICLFAQHEGVSDTHVVPWMNKAFTFWLVDGILDY